MSGSQQIYFQNMRSFGTPPGQDAYTGSGSWCWVAPAGVTSISVVAIGKGGCGGNGYRGPDYGGSGGGGGGLAYKNCIPVTPGASYSVSISCSSSSFAIPASPSVLAYAGSNGTTPGNSCRGSGGSASGGDANYSGGNGNYSHPSAPPCLYWAGAGGGAAGYTGNGVGPTNTGYPRNGGASGDGNPGGSSVGHGGGGGGGTSLLGSCVSVPGCSGNTNHSGGYGVPIGGGGGGGAGGSSYIPYSPSGVAKGPGGPGGVRIMWGACRAYPNTCAGDV